MGEEYRRWEVVSGSGIELTKLMWCVIQTPRGRLINRSGHSSLGGGGFGKRHDPYGKRETVIRVNLCLAIRSLNIRLDEQTEPLAVKLPTSKMRSGNGENQMKATFSNLSQTWQHYRNSCMEKKLSMMIGVSEYCASSEYYLNVLSVILATLQP